MPYVEGQLVRVVWAAEDGPYGVVRVRTAGGDVTAVGPLASLVDLAGDEPFVSIEGRWEDHAVHGRQLRATGYLLASPRTRRGLELYLASSQVEGVGPTLARRLVEHFDMATLRVLEDEPERLVEVPGIGPKRAATLAERWAADAGERSLSVLLRGLGLSARVVERVRRRYGPAAASVVRREPYRLAEEIHGVGFRRADDLARGQGLAEDDPWRLRAAAVHVLRSRGREGHTVTPPEVLRARVGELGVPTGDLDEAVEAAVRGGRVERVAEGLGLVEILHAEGIVAAGLAGRTARWPAPSVEVIRARWPHLDGEQARAVSVALESSAAVITGGPGTGKTTLVRVVLEAAEGEWILAAPTGRAARRLQESTGREASTLHRLLEIRPGEDMLRRDREPLRGRGLVVDEASMIDAELMAALVRALPDDPGFSLVLVGDADQLPSVGPGQVLRDLVEADVIPVVRLQRVYRQGEGSGIVEASRVVRAGRVPASGDRSGAKDFFRLEREDPAAALDTVLRVVQRLSDRFDPWTEILVLSPIHRGPLGTVALNEALQGRLNPDGAPVAGGRLRLGDRVVCTRNRYDLDVFNGDLGRVLAETDAGELVVDFDGQVVTWPRDALAVLDPAWALSVHKAQGSEVPAIVLVLHGVHGVLPGRNLVYTAITRARRFFCAVGTEVAWRRAAARDEGRRDTTLRRLLREPEAVDRAETLILWS